MNDLDFIKAAGIGMKAERIKGHRQRTSQEEVTANMTGTGCPFFWQGEDEVGMGWISTGSEKWAE